MALPAIFKRKWFWIVAAILVIGIIWYWRSSATKNAIAYETADVVRQNLVQTVEVTGTLKPASRIDLSFKSSGTLGKIDVNVGDAVKKGDVLAELKADDLVFAARSARAALSVAQANLDQRAAGETSQSIRVAETQVEQAQAAYDKAVSDLASAKLTTANAVTSSQIAWETAKHNLDNADAIASQNVQNSYDSIRSTLAGAIGPLNSALTDGDQIIGVDNTAQGLSYGGLVGMLDAGSVDRAKASYTQAKIAKLSAESLVNALTAQSAQADILAAAQKLRDAIALVQTYLTDVQRVLGASLTGSALSATQLTAYQTTIAADRTSVSTQNTSVLNAIQTITNTQLTRQQTVQQLQDAENTAHVAYENAQTNADTQIKAAETMVATQQAALNAAQATLDLKKAGPRAVDLSPLRAAVEQAQVAYDKAQNDLHNAQIVAPVDGVVSEIVPSVGEQVVMNATAVRMVGTATFSIEALIPEVDIAKVEVGQTATTTLDAYGDDVKFTGTVTAKDPDQTKVQDAVYYKTYVQIEPGTHDIKPGMTANVTVLTGSRSNALVIPLRAIRTANDGGKSVRVLVSGQPQDRAISVGLKGDEGRVEVLSGLREGEQVIVGETTK